MRFPTSSAAKQGCGLSSVVVELQKEVDKSVIAAKHDTTAVGGAEVKL